MVMVKFEPGRQRTAQRPAVKLSLGLGKAVECGDVRPGLDWR